MARGTRLGQIVITHLDGRRKILGPTFYPSSSQGFEMPPQHDFSFVHRLGSECFAMRVRTLDRVITNVYDMALRPLELKVTQLNILLVVGALGVARPSEICGLLRMDTSTLSRNADRLLSRGWLEVVRTSDARAQPLRLTVNGSRLISRAVPAWERAQSDVEQLLGRTGAAALMKSAARVGLGKNFRAVRPAR